MSSGADEREIAELLRQRISAQVSTYAKDRESAGLDPEPAAERRALVERLLSEQLQVHVRESLQAGRPALRPDAEERVGRIVLDSLFGAGVLERLLADRRVENITVNGFDTVWIYYEDGTKGPGPAIASSDEELIEIVRTLAARTGKEERRFDRGVPRLNLQLPDGSRLFALMAVSERVSLSVRRHRFRNVTLDELVKRRVCDEPLAALLSALVKARKNIIVGGGTNVGKTTLVMALAREISPEERLVTIEDTYELGLGTDRTAHPDVVALQAREANIEGEGAIDQAELVRWGLRMRPDRVIVGEIRGPEVIPMCNAMSQGNDGSLSTIHASTSRGVFTKLAAYAAQAPERLSREATSLLVASAVHFVVHLGWDREGVRVVDSVRQVVDAEDGQIVSNEIYAPGPDGRARPATPLAEDVLEKLETAGLDVALLQREWWKARGA
ncbi:CpaF family protein [Streptomyces monticola]|uniref:CpaF family protein n=1 Tax=Streptomyces monticola TaxID=2666263 RepID=A0ABW2JL06_9ACTN